MLVLLQAGLLGLFLVEGGSPQTPVVAVMDGGE